MNSALSDLSDGAESFYCCKGKKKIKICELFCRDCKIFCLYLQHEISYAIDNTVPGPCGSYVSALGMRFLSGVRLCRNILKRIN